MNPKIFSCHIEMIDMDYDDVANRLEKIADKLRENNDIKSGSIKNRKGDRVGLFSIDIESMYLD